MSCYHEVVTAAMSDNQSGVVSRCDRGYVMALHSSSLVVQFPEYSPPPPDRFQSVIPSSFVLGDRVTSCCRHWWVVGQRDDGDRLYVATARRGVIVVLRGAVVYSGWVNRRR